MRCMTIIHNFSQSAWDELNIVMEAVREEINVTCNAFMKDDREAAQRVAPLGAVITNLCDELKLHHVARLSKGECGLEEGTVFNDILNSFGPYCSPQRKCNDGADEERRRRTRIFTSTIPRSIRLTQWSIILISMNTDRNMTLMLSMAGIM